jgi:hypothetical protein
MSAEEVWEQDDFQVATSWVEHHMRGDWFTSRLFRLWQTADYRNRKKLAKGFPAECAIFTWWAYGTKYSSAERIYHGGNQ